MPTFATPGPVAATVEVAGAQVRVTARSRTDTVILVKPINEASRSNVKVADKTKVEFADGQLSVRTTTPGDKSGSVTITIDLPAGSSLAAYLAHSSVQVDGPVGQCELHLASGQVRLDRIEALQASIASGEVAIGHIAGRANIDGGAFAMRIGEVELSSCRARADRPGSATPRPTSISAATAATWTSTAPTAASPPQQPAVPFGSAG
jgi:hypothetical protein